MRRIVLLLMAPLGAHAVTNKRATATTTMMVLVIL